MTGTLLSGLGNRKRSPWCGTASPRFVGLAVPAVDGAPAAARRALFASFGALSGSRRASGRKRAKSGRAHAHKQIRVVSAHRPPESAPFRPTPRPPSQRRYRLSQFDVSCRYGGRTVTRGTGP